MDFEKSLKINKSANGSVINTFWLVNESDLFRHKILQYLNCLIIGGAVWECMTIQKYSQNIFILCLKFPFIFKTVKQQFYFSLLHIRIINILLKKCLFTLYINVSTVVSKIIRALEIIRVKNSEWMQFYEVNVFQIMNFKLLIKSMR